MKGILFLAGFVAFTLLGNIFFKRGAAEIASLGLTVEALSVVIRSLNTWLGVVFYGTAAILWFLALTAVPLNLAITVSACVYVLVILISFLLFREVIPPARWIGILLIFVGLIFVGRTL